MPRITRIMILAAIAAATAPSAPGIAAAAAGTGSGSRPPGVANSYWVAAERAAASQSAPLDRFSLIGVHTITPVPTAVVGTNSDPEGFQFGDAAVGAAVMAGLVLLGAAGALAVRRRAQVRHG